MFLAVQLSILISQRGFIVEQFLHYSKIVKVISGQELDKYYISTRMEGLSSFRFQI